MPVVVAVIVPKPDQVDEVRAILLAAVPKVHEEAGVKLYSLHEAPGKFVFVEEWADDAARWVRTWTAGWRATRTSPFSSRFRPATRTWASCAPERASSPADDERARNGWFRRAVAHLSRRWFTWTSGAIRFDQGSPGRIRLTARDPPGHASLPRSG
jgi:Antibiotic biosynthesis monooxygenase